jgi:hypothetical protein
VDFDEDSAIAITARILTGNSKFSSFTGEELFKHYSSTVIEFHNWLRSAVMDSYGTEISDYLQYQRLMKRFESQS